MAKLGISTGTTPNDGTGDNLLAGAVKINSNFNEIYTRFGDGTNLTSIGGTWTSTSVGIHTLKNVGIGTTNPRFLLEVGAVGASGTTLFVNGDARVTGIVTIGPASITLNGITNIINVGTGITINGSTGIISATSIVLGGTTLTGAAVTSITAGSGISVNQSTGNVTITATGGGGSSQWVTTVAGIHTLSNVGIGTTNPTSALTVTGNGTFTGVVTATTFVGALTGTATTATNAQGLSGTPNITVGVATASALKVSTGTTAATIDFGQSGSLQYSQPNVTLLSSYASGKVILTAESGIEMSRNNETVAYFAMNPSNIGYVELYYDNSKKFQTIGDGVSITGTIFTNQLNVSGLSTTSSLNVGTGGTVITTTTAGLVGIGTTNPTKKLTVSGDALINGLTVGLGSGAVTTNTAIGASALYSNTTGLQNTANGGRSLYFNTTGDGNTSTGYQALYYNTTGDFNTANGGGALAVNTGNQNTATGYGALNANTTSNYNTAIGSQSLGFNTTGSNNTASGTASLHSNTTGSNNTATGYQSFYYNTTGSNNTGIGISAGLDITTGSKNTLLGSYTGNQNGLDIRTSNNNVVLSDGDGNIRFYANSSGNVGLGTTNPTEKLTVSGNAVITGITTHLDKISIRTSLGSNEYASLSNAGKLVLGDGTSTTAGIDIVNNTSSSSAEIFTISTPNVNAYSKKIIVDYGGRLLLGGNLTSSINNALTILDNSGNITLSGYVSAGGTIGASGLTAGTVQISSGIVTATSGIVTYYGDTSYTASGRWTLGASGTNDYTFTGIGFTQTTNDPVLYLARGRVYEFVNNSGGGHPFEIRTSNGGSAYSNGVTNNAAASGIIRFEIPFNAPNTLYYQCTNHSGMGNTISVYPSTL